MAVAADISRRKPNLRRVELRELTFAATELIEPLQSA
jgi:hypothetical protein